MLRVTNRGAEGTDPVFGVGLQLRMKAFATRLEFERVTLGSGTSRVLSLGLLYTFH
jgi:hypothetical protein